VGRHDIFPPLEQCLVVENGINHFELVARAQKMLLDDPASPG
jgi:hypothetical protein